MEIFRFILAALLIAGGLFVAIVACKGMFKFRFVLNRMHAAALCDTLSIMLVLMGLVVACGFNLVSLKLFLIIVFLWFASPVSSHLLALLEVTINEHLHEQCDMTEAKRLCKEKQVDLSEVKKDLAEEEKEAANGK